MEDFNRYTITEASQMTGLKDYQIRNTEKYLNIFFARDTSGNRFFTDKDIEVLKIVGEARQHNIPYEVIRKQLEAKNLIEALSQEAVEKTEIEKLTILDLKSIIKESIAESIADAIVEREIELKKEFEERLDQVKEEIILKQQEQAQTENDRLMKYIALSREAETKKSLWSRLFGK